MLLGDVGGGVGHQRGIRMPSSCDANVHPFIGAYLYELGCETLNSVSGQYFIECP